MKICMLESLQVYGTRQGIAPGNLHIRGVINLTMRIQDKELTENNMLTLYTIQDHRDVAWYWPVQYGTILLINTNARENKDVHRLSWRYSLLISLPSADTVEPAPMMMFSLLRHPTHKCWAMSAGPLVARLSSGEARLSSKENAVQEPHTCRGYENRKVEMERHSTSHLRGNQIFGLTRVCLWFCQAC